PTFAGMMEQLRLNDLRGVGAELRQVIDSSAEFRRTIEALQPAKIFSESIAPLVARDALSSSLIPATFAELWQRVATLPEIGDNDVEFAPGARRSRVDELDEKVDVLQAEVDSLKAALNLPAEPDLARSEDGDEDLHTGQY